MLATVVALFIALAYVWVMQGPRWFLFNISPPANASFPVRMAVDIFAEWLMAGLYSLVFAILIGTIYKRVWLFLAVTIGVTHLALLFVQYGTLSCGHMRWIADCLQARAREAFILPLLTWPVARIAAHVRAL
jgi:hypothetical protein